MIAKEKARQNLNVSKDVIQTTKKKMRKISIQIVGKNANQMVTMTISARRIAKYQVCVTIALSKNAWRWWTKTSKKTAVSIAVKLYSND